MSRYPVEAKAIGLVQHGRQKLYMFCILWSDRNNIRIYRTYDNFKDLSKLLTKIFPLEAGLVNKSDRVLPILKDVLVLFRTRFSARFLERLRLLEVYSQELLQTDSKISKCEDVIQFFSPNNQDLTPSFPEDSLVILPPENDQGQKKMTCPPKVSQPTTQPIISETYLCIDTFETKDTKNRPFKVKKNESLDVLIKDSTGWWLVENEEKCLAWFPAPYLIKSEPLNSDARRTSCSRGTFYYAEKAFEAQNSDEISLSVGVVVEVIEESDIGWWLICYNGRFGYVPAMFLKPYKNPHQNLQVTFNQDRFGSSSNLFKAVSNLDISNGLALDQNGTREADNRRARLRRMKSRSLTGLEDLSDLSAQNFSKSRREDKVYVERSKEDTGDLRPPSAAEKPVGLHTQYVLHDCHGLCTEDGIGSRADLMDGKKRADSGFDSIHSSPRISVSSDNGGSSPPPVPQRPSLQEIHSRCTTITRKAVIQQNV
ncbi:NADPH oxidase organizer 1-like [Pseudophryne corroboree]|uniref:NADPH oxidase organizer 1-like n=1 Tax=Pseudophryne corroboree TaxID=495146 RepID=UPI0030817DE7